jgi:hypothetical protein
MKKWIQKALVQKTISFLPYGHKINYLFQKYVTKGVYLSDEYFYDRLGHAKKHLESFQNHTKLQTPTTCLEIGTGWYPVVPVSFFLSGAEKIYSVDITFLTSKVKIQTTLLKFVESQKNGKLKDFIHFKPERMEVIEKILGNYSNLTTQEILLKLNIVYLIEDARQLSLPDNSVDLINSNNTFEHIYPHILIPILKEFKRVVKKESGVMSHFIDMSDHFAHFDKSISIYNFLKFSDSQWKWIDNSIQPQSRLRINDYKSIYQELNIPISEETIRPGNTDELQKIALDKKYTHYNLADLAVSHCHFVSKID